MKVSGLHSDKYVTCTQLFLLQMAEVLCVWLE